MIGGTRSLGHGRHLTCSPSASPNPSYDIMASTCLFLALLYGVYPTLFDVRSTFQSDRQQSREISSMTVGWYRTGRDWHCFPWILKAGWCSVVRSTEYSVDIYIVARWDIFNFITDQTHSYFYSKHLLHSCNRIQILSIYLYTPEYTNKTQNGRRRILCTSTPPYTHPTQHTLHIHSIYAPFTVN